MGKNQAREKLGWDNVLEKEDFFITFLLYREGKNIQLISKIRNLPREVIENHIIQAKMILKVEKTQSNLNYKNIFIELLASTKTERISYLNSCTKKIQHGLVQHLMKVLPTIENAEDKMIALWICGQLGDVRLLPLIYKEMEHKHGGVRRMVCSCLGKIESEESVEILHRGLQDVKPQVRQYAAKALGKIGNEKTIKRLKGLLNNPKELDYVKRAYEQAINSIETRLGTRTN